VPVRFISFYRCAISSDQDVMLTVFNLVLGCISETYHTVDAKSLSTDHNGNSESERIRILNEHSTSEAPTLFAGGRLFGHIATTRS
jgi:hypothetical protein